MDGTPETAADLSAGAALQFFISRTGADKAIALAIADILTDAGHRVLIQDDHFDHRNFMAMMDAGLASGARVIAVLSEDYLKSDHCALEWYHPLADDPLNRKARLIVMRVGECAPAGYLKAIAYWDLVKARGKPEQLKAAVLGAIDPAARERPSLAQYWQAPGVVVHDRIRATPGFTGRGEELAEIDKALWARETAALMQSAAVKGFGGVGKSTIAKEYAWRVSAFPDAYAGVWWLDAEKSREADSWPGLETGYLALGDVFIRGLALQQDRPKAARTGRDFIDQAGFERPWLLIYDNVDDVRALEAWPPPKGAHVIVTSRLTTAAKGMTAVEVDTWPVPDAVRYLKANSGRADMTEAEAEAIATELGCLPLALAHAAAYLADNDNATPESYLAAVRQHMRDVPESALAIAPRAVFATLQENIAQAETRAPGAAAVMALAAFFAPDAIPEELFRQDAALYPPAFAGLTGKGPALEKAIGALARLSLIAYDRATTTFSVHRLVQAAARDGLDSPSPHAPSAWGEGRGEGQQTAPTQAAPAQAAAPHPAPLPAKGGEREVWAEAAVKAANAAFPEVEFENWPVCARLLDHALAAAEIATDEVGEPLGRLLNQVAIYQYSLGAYELAKLNYERSLVVRERELGAEHAQVGQTLHNLATVYETIGQYNLAKKFFERSLSISEKAFGSNHPNVAQSLSNLALVHGIQGELELAEPLLRRSLAIVEHALGADHPDIRFSLGNLAELYRAQGKHDLAMPYCQRALEITEKANGPDHPEVGALLDNLAQFHETKAEYELAEPLYRRALAIREKALGPDHADVGITLNNLAILLYQTNRKREALEYARRARTMMLRALGAEHPTTQTVSRTLTTIAADLGEPGP